MTPADTSSPPPTDGDYFTVRLSPGKTSVLVVLDVSAIVERRRIRDINRDIERRMRA